MPSPLRNEIIVKRPADTGLRVTELVSLTCGAVRQDPLVVNGKGNKHLALTQTDLQKAHRNASPVDRLGQGPHLGARRSHLT